MMLSEQTKMYNAGVFFCENEEFIICHCKIVSLNVC